MPLIEPERYRKYEQFRLVADPLADAAAAAFAGMPAGTARKVFETALNTGIDQVEDPPAAIVELFKQVERFHFGSTGTALIGAARPSCARGL
jgi:hypothetical protein